MTEPRSDPRQKFVETARALFAAHGYYGVSLADVSKELGLTKQSVLYHFKTKEALYGEVLDQLAARFEAVLAEVAEGSAAGEERFRVLLVRLYDHMRREPTDAGLIMRELLDNRDRAEESRKWYLRPFLDAFVDLLGDLPRWRGVAEPKLAAAAYQIIGAVNYFAVSGPTLRGIWGRDRAEAMAGQFLPTLVETWADGHQSGEIQPARLDLDQ